MTKTSEEAFQEFVEADPLYLFDLYPMMQAKYVEELGEEILSILDTNLGADVVVGTDINSAHSKFWFWILGAYELVRTLSQHSVCFSSDRQAKIAELKRQLAPVRIAFAKLEVPNARRVKGKTDFLDRSPFFSISNLDRKSRDLGFQVGGTNVGMRPLIVSFLAFKRSLRVHDIVAGLYHDRSQEIPS